MHPPSICQQPANELNGTRMQQINDYSDERLWAGCLYCGGSINSKEHVPSRMFLDEPYPRNLPTIGSCKGCNNSFSLDEAYLACLIETSLAGTMDPAAMRRKKIAGQLQQSPKLRSLLQYNIDRAMPDQAVYLGERERVERILTKLARSHAAFELAQDCRELPSSIWYCDINHMHSDVREEFDSLHVLGPLGAIGSRGSMRTVVIQFTAVGPDGTPAIIDFAANDWLEVQEQRYLAIEDEQAVRVRLVISDYFACEVAWEKDTCFP